MKTSRRSALTTLLASMATAAVSASTTAWDSRQRSTIVGGEARFTNSRFLDHEGRPVRFYQDIIRNKVVVLNMMYTACTSICPGNTANLLQVQRALGERIGRDIHLVSISLLPELDPPSALLSYMQRFEVGPGWTFLTGTAKNTDVVRRRIGFYDSDPVADADVFQHTGMLSIGNDRIDRWCMMPALSSIEQIVRSIEEMAGPSA